MKTKNILKWLACNSMELIAGIALTASILITTVNALTRYTIRVTWNPGTDITTLCFAWVVFCGAAAAYKRKMHYGIDILVSHLPAKVKPYLEIPTHFIVIAALAYVTYLSFDLSVHVGGKILSNTKISYFWYDLSAIIGFTYMTVYEVIFTVEDIKALKCRKETAE